MTTGRVVMLVLATTLLFRIGSVADATGTVSIVGKNIDTTDGKACGLTLIIAGTTWTEAEAGNDVHFFKTKKGSYVRISNVVSLLDSNKKEVGRLNNIVPESAKQGDKGNGYAEETGISFSWEVK
jgi:hypothetical protein